MKNEKKNQIKSKYLSLNSLRKSLINMAIQFR